MREELRELWRFRELFLSMTQRELRIRYKNSFLGVLWSFVNPLMTAAVMTLVFGFLLRDIRNFSAYVLSALLPFTFFQAGVLDSAQSVLASLPIVKKVYLPRELLPLAAIASNFVHLLAGFVVFFLYLFLWVYARSGFHHSPFQATTWMLPFLLLVSLCLTTGVGLVVSALNTFYEDVKYLMNAGMYLLSFLCPIVYFHEDVANRLQGHNVWLYRLYMANPMATLCVCYRKALLDPVNVNVLNQNRQELANASDFPWAWLAYTAVLSVAILAYGYHLFNRMKWRFVERP